MSGWEVTEIGSDSMLCNTKGILFFLLSFKTGLMWEKGLNSKAYKFNFY